MVCPQLLLGVFLSGGGYDRTGCQRQVSCKANLLNERNTVLATVRFKKKKHPEQIDFTAWRETLAGRRESEASDSA